MSTAKKRRWVDWGGELQWGKFAALIRLFTHPHGTHQTSTHTHWVNFLLSIDISVVLKAFYGWTVASAINGHLKF